MDRHPLHSPTHPQSVPPPAAPSPQVLCPRAAGRRTLRSALRQPLQRLRAAAVAAAASALFKAAMRSASASSARLRLPRRALCRVEVLLVADLPFLCDCAPPRRARLRFAAPPPYGPYPKPAHVYGSCIGAAKYLIKNNRPGYVSQAYPSPICTRYGIRRVLDVSVFLSKNELH
jgi:hypothetical protein